MIKPDIYYSVDNRVYENKIDAVLDANRTMSEVKWHFFEDDFRRAEWSKEPQESLDTLYRIRAQEIRDSYDYVVILCSGGADSTNVLKTFINNKIKVDEIIAAAPLEGLRDYQFNDKDTSHRNTISETVYVQIPFINEIAQQHPEIRVTLHDYFQDIINYKSDEWLYSSDDWLHPSGLARYRYERVTHLRNMADAGKRIAFVYGIDKPSLMRTDDDEIHILFSDLAVNVRKPPFDRPYPNVDAVMFYWDKTTTTLLRKQAHQLTKWIFQPENVKALCWMPGIRASKIFTFEERRFRNSKYERAIVPCIYPTTHKSIFQTEKPTKIFMGELDEWFYSHHKSTRSFEMIWSDTLGFYKNINDKYLNEGKNGLQIFFNRYKIGKREDILRGLI